MMGSLEDMMSKEKSEEAAAAPVVDTCNAAIQLNITSPWQTCTSGTPWAAAPLGE
jgi:hypothetical protein